MLEGHTVSVNQASWSQDESRVLTSAALNAGKIQFDKFNAAVSKANRHGYAAALEELQAIV